MVSLNLQSKASWASSVVILTSSTTGNRQRDRASGWRVDARVPSGLVGIQCAKGVECAELSASYLNAPLVTSCFGRM